MLRPTRRERKEIIWPWTVRPDARDGDPLGTAFGRACLDGDLSIRLSSALAPAIQPGVPKRNVEGLATQLTDAGVVRLFTRVAAVQRSGACARERLFTAATCVYQNLLPLL